jgi:branched-chain amino acid transport system ATP-binding protein
VSVLQRRGVGAACGAGPAHLWGATLLIVEQDVQIALEQAHYGYVLETGQIALQGDGADLLADRRIQQAFLGLAAE